MSTSQIKIGQAGEQIAVQFLSQNGYTVVERNWRHEHQEIDIIAKDDHFLVFVEVNHLHYIFVSSFLYTLFCHHQLLMLVLIQ